MILGESIWSKYSLPIFWRNELLAQSKNDYFNLFGSPEFNSEAMLLSYSWDQENSLGEIHSIIKDLSFEPDLFIARGEVNQMWPIKVLKDKGEIECPIFLILDKLSHPIVEYDLEILDIFDKIISMGPSCDIEEIKDKNLFFFEKIESYSFHTEPPNVDFSKKRVDTPLFLCSEKNYDYVEKNVKFKKSVINIDRCPVNEMIFLIYLCKNIVNLTGEMEIDLILKKMNRRTLSLQNLENLANNGKKCHFEEYSKINLKDFCDQLKNFIFENFNNLKEKKIEAEEITI